MPEPIPAIDDAIDETRCPICGKPNGCGAHAASPCWCRKETISPALRALVPAEKRMRACLCVDCIRRYADSTEVP